MVHSGTSTLAFCWLETIFDLSAIRNYQAGRAGVRVAELQEALAREQVASGTGLIYLEALRADASVVAAQANVDLAEALLKLAQDQRNAGVATGVDVTRAQTRLAEQQVGLAQAQTASEQARLNLQRVVWPAARKFADVNRSRCSSPNEPLPAVETADRAKLPRIDAKFRLPREQNKVSQLERKAVSAEYLPSVELVGDYGVSGINRQPRGSTDAPHCGSGQRANLQWRANEEGVSRRPRAASGKLSSNSRIFGAG